MIENNLIKEHCFKYADRTYSFVLTVITITTLFNGIYGLLLPMSIRMLIELLLFLIILLPDYKVLLNYKNTVFFIGFVAITFIFLTFYVNNNHYGFNKLFLNSIATFYYTIMYLFLYLKSCKHIFTKYLKKLIAFSLIINFILFILYVLYNKRNGILGITPIQLVIFQDWEGRFQGSFSEPGGCGWYLVCMFFLVLLLYKNKIKYIIALLILYILYFACQAKFILIGLPFSLFINIFINRIKVADKRPLVFLLIFIICILGLLVDNIMNGFYSNLAKTIPYEDSGTYVTRFSFIFASLENIAKYPLGSGFGMNFEVFRDNMEKISILCERYGLVTWEIRGYLVDMTAFGPKETFSMMASIFGFIGIYIYISHFINLYNISFYNSYICKSLILFAFLESILSKSFFASVGILPLLYCRMALNEQRR